jgi:hypothetical protein
MYYLLVIALIWIVLIAVANIADAYSKRAEKKEIEYREFKSVKTTVTSNTISDERRAIEAEAALLQQCVGQAFEVHHNSLVSISYSPDANTKIPQKEIEKRDGFPTLYVHFFDYNLKIKYPVQTVTFKTRLEENLYTKKTQEVLISIQYGEENRPEFKQELFEFISEKRAPHYRFYRNEYYN